MRFRVKWTTNLSCVVDATVCDPERMHRPVQVESLLGLPERQTLSQSSLINLDNSDTVLLEILHFILNGQSNLVAGLESENWKK